MANSSTITANPNISSARRMYRRQQQRSGIADACRDPHPPSSGADLRGKPAPTPPSILQRSDDQATQQSLQSQSRRQHRAKHQPLSAPTTIVVHSHRTAIASATPRRKQTPSRQDKQRITRSVPGRRPKECAAPGCSSTLGFGRLGLHRPRIRIRSARRGRRTAARVADIRVSRIRARHDRNPANRWHEDQVAIGRLPEQEIRQALLAAGADDQVGIGNVGRVEEARRTSSMSMSAAVIRPFGDCSAMRCARARFPAARRS